MKRFTLAVALTCVLSISALAGEMPTVRPAATSSTETPVVTATTAPGELPTVETDSSLPGEMQGILETLILVIITWP